MSSFDDINLKPDFIKYKKLGLSYFKHSLKQN